MRCALVLTLMGSLLVGCGSNDVAGNAPRQQPDTQTVAPDTSAKPTQSPRAPRFVKTLATGLEVPWGLAFLPSGEALVTERDSGLILGVSASGRVRTVGEIDSVAAEGEAGLLGLALSPTFDRDRFVYAYVSTADDNRVIRLPYQDGTLGAPEVILDGIPRGFIHDGGRLLFAADGTLFVTTGDAGEEELAQDPASLGGKILHLTADGEPAANNPIPPSATWTLGHRNVQGLAFDDRGRLWASEFGKETWDELNLIEPGRNYGWPDVEGKGDDARYQNPFVQWTPEEASPSGLAFAKGALWMASLKGERLWRIPVTRDGVGKPRAYFIGKFGRLRTVAVAPDGNLWVTTSNNDGRGEPTRQDDRVLLIRP